MLIRLWRTHLGRRPGLLAALVALQMLSTLAALTLPSLNGRIIDDGVAVGDTGFILRAGAVMLGVSLMQVIATIASGEELGMLREMVAWLLETHERQVDQDAETIGAIFTVAMIIGQLALLIGLFSTPYRPFAWLGVL